MSALLELARAGGKPVVGMVQLAPLAGSSRYRGGGIGAVLDAAVEDAALLARAGFDAAMLQNLGDLPVDGSVAPVQVAWMTRVAAEVARECRLPVGLNFLENDAAAMFAVASAVAIDFVRIKIFVGAMATPAGIEGGQAFAAQRARNAWNAHATAIFADVHDRTGVPLGSAGLAEDIHHAVALGGADGLVLTGRSWAETLAFLETGRRSAHGAPLLIGGSVTPDTVGDMVAHADGAMVSSCLKPAGTAFGRLDPARVERFMAAARQARGAGA